MNSENSKTARPIPKFPKIPTTINQIPKIPKDQKNPKHQLNGFGFLEFFGFFWNFWNCWNCRNCRNFCKFWNLDFHNSETIGLAVLEFLEFSDFWGIFLIHFLTKRLVLGRGASIYVYTRIYIYVYLGISIRIHSPTLPEVPAGRFKTRGLPTDSQSLPSSHCPRCKLHALLQCVKELKLSYHNMGMS